MDHPDWSALYDLMWSCINVATVLAALPAIGAYLCRVNLLFYGQHRVGLVLLHAALAGCCMWAIHEISAGNGGMLTLLAVSAACLHITTSLRGWVSGHVPDYYNSDRAPLDPPNEPAASRPTKAAG